MFASIFNPETPFWQKISSFADILGLSLLWLLTALPLFSVGSATAALYDASARCVRTGKSGAIVRYLTVFRRELLPSIPLTLMALAGLSLLSAPMGLFWWATVQNMAGGSLALAAYGVVLLIPLGAFCWLFPLLSRFALPPLGLVKVSCQLSVAYLPRTVAAVLVTILAILLSALFWFPMLVLPCITALLWSYLMEGPFQAHQPPTH